MSVWVLSTKTVKTGLYRCISITEQENGTFKINALMHVPEKEDIVTNGIYFEPRTQTVYDNIGEINIEYNGGTIAITTEKTSDTNPTNTTNNLLTNYIDVTYDISILKDNSLISIEKGLLTPDFSIDNLENGTYTALIVKKATDGKILARTSKDFIIDKPPLVTNILVNSTMNAIVLQWDYIDEHVKTEIWVSDTDDIETSKLLTTINGRIYTHNVGSEQIRYYWLRNVKANNKSAYQSVQGVRGISGKDVSAEIDF